MEQSENVIETHLDLIERLIDHLEGVRNPSLIDTDLPHDLLSAFPSFRYEGEAYRATRGEWNPQHPNISWSSNRNGADFAFQTNNSGARNYWLYYAQVVGFDVKKFFDAYYYEIESANKGKVSLYSEYEFEIIVVEIDKDSFEHVG